MTLTIKGKVTQVLKPESGVSKAGNEWSKQDFVIETDEQFPKKVCFTLFGDKTSLLNGLAAGTEVEVSFNIESREYNGKYFHNINAWKIDRVADESLPEVPPEFSMNDIPPPPEDMENDLPF